MKGILESLSHKNVVKFFLSLHFFHRGRRSSGEEEQFSRIWTISSWKNSEIHQEIHELKTSIRIDHYELNLVIFCEWLSKKQ